MSKKHFAVFLVALLFLTLFSLLNLTKTAFAGSCCNASGCWTEPPTCDKVCGDPSSCCTLGVNCPEPPPLNCTPGVDPGCTAPPPGGGGECQCEDNIECCKGYKDWDGKNTTLAVAVKEKDQAVAGPYQLYFKSGNGKLANQIITDVGDTIYFFPAPAFRRVATYNLDVGLNYGACGWPWFNEDKTSWNCPKEITMGNSPYNTSGIISGFQYNVVDFWWLAAEEPVQVSIRVRDCDKITCGNWSACDASGRQSRTCTQYTKWRDDRWRECFQDTFTEGRSCGAECTAGEEVTCYDEPIIYSEDGLTWSSNFTPQQYIPFYDPQITYSGNWTLGETSACVRGVKPEYTARCYDGCGWTFLTAVNASSETGAYAELKFRGNQVNLITALHSVAGEHWDGDSCVVDPTRFYTQFDVTLDGNFLSSPLVTGSTVEYGNHQLRTFTIVTPEQALEGEHTLRVTRATGSYNPPWYNQPLHIVAFEVYSSCTPQGSCPINPWWQAVDGDVQTNGDLQSNVPTGANLIEDGPGGYPGVALFGGLTANLGSGEVSTRGWLANSVYSGRIYDTEYFKNLVPSTTSMNTLPQTIDGAALSGGIPSGGYTWFTRDGDLTVGSDITLSGGQKVIVFVNGDLNLNANITIANPGDDFLIFLVGEDADGNGGNINVDPTVTALGGIYLADDRFASGTSDQQLIVTGSVTAWGGMILGREIQGSEASEIFEYSPGLIMAFPQALMRERIVWKEVAP